MTAIQLLFGVEDDARSEAVVTTKSDTTGKNYIGQKELLNNVTRNTSSLFGTETIQTARYYRSISGHSKTITLISQLTGVF